MWQRTDVQALGVCLFLPKYWLKDIYIPDCKISLASFVLYFHLLLIRSFIRIRSFFFVSWSLLKKLNLFVSNLKDKARRSFFASRRYLDFSKIQFDEISITNKLFTSLFISLFSFTVQRYGESMTKKISTPGEKIVSRKLTSSFVNSH